MGFLFLILFHYLSGNGFLNLFKIRLKPLLQIPLSLICGVAMLSLVPFVLQLLYIPIGFWSVLSGICLLAILLNLSWLAKTENWSLKSLKMPEIKFSIYEWPFMMLFGMIMTASVFRAWYLPPSARDMLSGPEVIAAYTVREHTMINSVLAESLETTNNHLKPPFITGLQIIYKLFGIYFGQLWLSILFVSFIVFLYQLLKERMHALLACIFLTLFLAIPELYGYTYIMLFDYSNMVFFFLGYYFLHLYFNSDSRQLFYFSAVLFGIATYIRSETLILTGMTLPLYWFYAFQHKQALKKVLIQSLVFLAISFFAYYIWVGIFLRFYMPGQFDLGSQINHDIFNLQPLVTRFEEMNTKVLYGKIATLFWGYYFFVFCLLVLAEVIFVRKVSKEARFWWYGVLVVYIGLPLIGFLIPLVDLLNTTKRGIFKMLPFMLMVMANNGLLKRLSDIITRWEVTPAIGKKQPLAPSKDTAGKQGLAKRK